LGASGWFLGASEWFLGASEWFLGARGKLNTTILTIKEIRIHPKYSPLSKDSQEGGPKDGYDISVYIVNDSNFTMNSSFIWPACLPKAESQYVDGNRAILAGWIAPSPFYYLVPSTTLRGYELKNLWQSEALYERVSTVLTLSG
jgi:hypothetical protein